MIISKVVCTFFPGATPKDFVHYIKPTLQENEFDTLVLHISVNDILKSGSNVDTVMNIAKISWILPTTAKSSVWNESLFQV